MELRIRINREIVARIIKAKLMGMTPFIIHLNGRPKGASELSLTRKDS